MGLVIASTHVGGVRYCSVGSLLRDGAVSEFGVILLRLHEGSHRFKKFSHWYLRIRFYIFVCQGCVYTLIVLVLRLLFPQGFLVRFNLLN